MQLRGVRQERFRSSRQVELEPLAVRRGLRLFEARSLGSTRSYRVRLPSLDRLDGSCTCPDFQTNELGCCKHLEAARRAASKARRRSAPRAPIYLHERSESPTVPPMLEPGQLREILDEAQRIKNWNTKTASALKRVRTRCAFLLTGTPLENRLEDLYSLLQVVDPRILGPLWRFRHEHMVAGDKGGDARVEGLGQLRDRLASVILRRDRRLVADQLPARQRIRREVPLTERQRELHDEATSAASRLAAIQAGRPLSFFEERRLLMLLQRARMACNAAFLVDKDEAQRGSPKLDALRELLTELCLEGARKVVVFSEWERMTALAEGVARSLGLGSARLHGGVPSRARGALLDRFEDDPDCQVFLSTDAGGVGLNLQAGQALINLDQPFNPARLEQRIARIHRLGQQAATQVFLVVASDSYEERVWEAIQGKRQLFAQPLHEDADRDLVVLGSRARELAAAVDVEGLEDPAPGPPSPTERLRSQFGARLKAVVRANGGLLAVLEEVSAQDTMFCEEFEAEVPVGCLLPPGLAPLRRLGIVQEGLWVAPTRPARQQLELAREALQQGNTRAAIEAANRSLDERLSEQAPVDPKAIGALLDQLAGMLG